MNKEFHNDNINWEEVESKISLICYKFNNINPKWHEDLAQELRIHAYYVSDDYYNLYRKAIDFWRKLQTREMPELPYYDLEVLGRCDVDRSHMKPFDDIVSLVRKELQRPAQSKWDADMLNLANSLFDIIISDIDDRTKTSQDILDKSKSNHYINQRLNLSWVAEETGIGYKRLVNAMKFLEDTIRGLHAMHKIEIPEEYFQGYYEEK